MSLKTLVSLILLVIFPIMVVTGIVSTPMFRKKFGLATGRGQPTPPTVQKVHVILGIAMAILGTLHAILERARILAVFRKRKKKAT